MISTKICKLDFTLILKEQCELIMYSHIIYNVIKCLMTLKKIHPAVWLQYRTHTHTGGYDWDGKKQF